MRSHRRFLDFLQDDLDEIISVSPNQLVGRLPWDLV
jgi:hypothetical protein